MKGLLISFLSWLNRWSSKWLRSLVVEEPKRHALFVPEALNDEDLVYVLQWANYETDINQHNGVFREDVYSVHGSVTDLLAKLPRAVTETARTRVEAELDLEYALEHLCDYEVSRYDLMDEVESDLQNDVRTWAVSREDWNADVSKTGRGYRPPYGYGEFTPIVLPALRQVALLDVAFRHDLEYDVQERVAV